MAGLLVVVLSPSPASYAAVVNGVHISQASLNQQLADIAADAKYVQLINQGGSSPVAGSRPGTYNKALRGRRIVLNENGDRGDHPASAWPPAKGLPTPAEVAAAKTEASAGYPAGIFSSFRVRYQDLGLETVQAAVAEMPSCCSKRPTSPSGVSPGTRTRHQAHQNRYATEACVRHILIADKNATGQIDYAASLSQAASIKAQLAAGGDFATLAMQDSQDNGSGGSAASGGVLTGSASDGCLTSQDLSQLVMPFAQAVVALPVDQVSDPVKTQFGYHLIEVTKRVVEPLDSAVTADIRQQMSAVKLNQLVAQARIKINPTFGTFNKTANPSTGQATGVVPPPGSACRRPRPRRATTRPSGG